MSTLILDIQSSSVHGSVIAPKTLETLFETEIEIPRRATVESKKLIENTLYAAKYVVNDLRLKLAQSKVPMKIVAVHCVISSPWILSQAQLVSASFSKPTKITDKLLYKLLDNEQAKPNIHITGREHEAGNLKIIERKVFSVMLNGYPVTDWQNKKTKTIGVSFAVSSTSSQFIDGLQEICETVVPKRSTFFHSAIILHYIASANSVPSAKTHVCVHVHNENTDMISISKDGNIFFASYPIGLETIARRIANAGDTKKHVADSMFNLYADQNLDQAQNRRSGVIMEKVLNDWSLEYRNFLKLAGISHKTPVHVFVSAKKHPKLFMRLMRIPGSNARIELLTDHVLVDNIYAKAIHMI